MVYSANNIPKLRISIDFAKQFNPKNPPNIFDKFLTELRKTVPQLSQSRNIIDSSKIITELIVLHEAAHIILDEKINKTYLKAAYELKNEDYDGSSIQQYVRLIHESFADGITTYLAKEHYPNTEITKCYRDARNNTYHETASEDKLNIYDTISTIGHVDNSNINKTNAVNYIFELAVENSLSKLQEKINSSHIFKNKLLKDLNFLNNKECIKLNPENIIDSLRINIFDQLNNPLPLKEILSKEKDIQLKKQTFKNMDSILNKFRTKITLDKEPVMQRIKNLRNNFNSSDIRKNRIK